MPNDWTLLGKRLQAYIEAGLTKAELCRKARVSSSQLDGYLEDPKRKRTLRAPGLDTAERLAEAVGKPLWELLRPEGAQPRVERVDHHLAECYRRVAEDAGRRAQAPAPLLRAAEPTGEGELAQRIARLSPEGRSQLETALGSIERGLQVDAEKPAK